MIRYPVKKNILSITVCILKEILNKILTTKRNLFFFNPLKQFLCVDRPNLSPFVSV